MQFLINSDHIIFENNHSLAHLKLHLHALLVGLQSCEHLQHGVSSGKLLPLQVQRVDRRRTIRLGYRTSGHTPSPISTFPTDATTTTTSCLWTSLGVSVLELAKGESLQPLGESSRVRGRGRGGGGGRSWRAEMMVVTTTHPSIWVVVAATAADFGGSGSRWWGGRSSLYVWGMGNGEWDNGYEHIIGSARW